MKNPNPTIVVSTDAAGYFGDICHGIADARDHFPDIRIIQCPVGFKVENLRMPPDGLIIQAITPERIDQWRPFGIPMINISGSDPDPLTPWVSSDFRKAGELGADHLLERGLKTSAVLYKFQVHHSEEKRIGFENRMKEEGGMVHSFPLIGKNMFPFYRLQNDLCEWILNLPKPCGLLCDDDFVAKCVIDQLYELGVDVPRDLAVIGINDNRLLCELSPIPISSVQLNGREVGRNALKWLMSAIQGNPDDSFLEPVVPSGITLRASTDVQFTQDPLVSRGLQYIRSNLHEALTVEELAESLHVSRRVLERRFNKTLGHPPYAEITQSRIRKAKELMECQPDLSIQEVAYRCGYRQTNLFYRQFRRQENLSPGTWKQNHQKT